MRLSPTRHNSTATAFAARVGDLRSRGDLTERAGRPQQGGRPQRGWFGRACRCCAAAAPPAQGGRAQEGGDGPPWQRGGARPQQPGPRPNEPSTEKRPSGQAGGVEAAAEPLHLRHRGAGSRRSGARQTSPSLRRAVRVPPTEAYASELPDLSGPVPRGPHRKPAPERPAETPSSSATGRAASWREPGRPRKPRQPGAGFATHPLPGAGQHVDPPDRPSSTSGCSSDVLSAAMFFVSMTAAAFLTLALGGMGVLSKS